LKRQRVVQSIQLFVESRNVTVEDDPRRVCGGEGLGGPRGDLGRARHRRGTAAAPHVPRRPDRRRDEHGRQTRGGRLAIGLVVCIGVNLVFRWSNDFFFFEQDQTSPTTTGSTVAAIGEFSSPAARESASIPTATKKKQVVGFVSFVSFKMGVEKKKKKKKKKKKNRAKQEKNSQNRKSDLANLKTKFKNANTHLRMRCQCRRRLSPRMSRHCTGIERTTPTVATGVPRLPAGQRAWGAPSDGGLKILEWTFV
jgi:hypothetical protein